MGVEGKLNPINQDIFPIFPKIRHIFASQTKLI